VSEETTETQEQRPAEKARPAERIRAAPAGPPAAVVLPHHAPGQPRVSRRGILRIGFWTSLSALITGAIGGGINLIYPRRVRGVGGKVQAGPVSRYPPGSKTAIAEGRFWLVHLTEEQGGPGLIALWWKCPHLGCTVPWRPTFSWPDPATGQLKLGWFRCPCHGSTYTDAGIRVYGPAPRPMDTMELTVQDGQIVVDTGKIRPGGPDNPERAVSV
jgi:cytochrome b6-f complex iron-sulfur subunit